MLGAGADQDCTASLDLECFVIDDHEPAPADHDVDLLAVQVTASLVEPSWGAKSRRDT